MRINSIILGLAIIIGCSTSNAQVYYKLKQGDVLQPGFFSSSNANNLISGLNSSGATAKLNPSLLAPDSRYPTIGITQQYAVNPMQLPQTGSVLQLIPESNININQISGGSPGQVFYITNMSSEFVIRFNRGSAISIRGESTMVLGRNESCTILVVENNRYSIW